jgi:hypothetical protein
MQVGNLKPGTFDGDDRVGLRHRLGRVIHSHAPRIRLSGQGGWVPSEHNRAGNVDALAVGKNQGPLPDGRRRPGDDLPRDDLPERSELRRRGRRTIRHDPPWRRLLLHRS